MAKVDFLYNGDTIEIQCKVEDKMEDIVEQFLNKFQKDKDSVCFLYSGNILDIDLTFLESANKLDKERKIMKVQALDALIEKNETTTMKRSNFIICPKCKEKARIWVEENYQISLYECKNDHEINNIKFNEFENTQIID